MAPHTVFDEEVWKIDSSFLFVVNGSFCSNTHRFRDIEVFLEAGNDVMVIYPLGGALYTDVDWWLMVVFALTRTISQILRFFWKPEMTS